MNTTTSDMLVNP